ncbi:MAG: hypothetical protein AB7V32_05060 [Candidatus Berkiella sp.]
MTIQFLNCKYLWQSQEGFATAFAGLHFETPEEYETVADLLIDQCQAASARRLDRNQEIAKLNQALKEDIESLLENIDAPQDFVNDVFINEHLAMFGLQAFIDQAQANQAYISMVQGLFIEKAQALKALPTAQRELEIAQRKEKIKENQANQQVLSAKEPPAQAASTHQYFLRDFIGNEAKFSQVFELLKSDPCLSECKSVLGNWQGIYTDEENLRWQFEIIGQNDGDLLILIKNYDGLHLSQSDPNKVIPSLSAARGIAIEASYFPKGQFEYSSHTIKDLLLSRIKEITFFTYCLCFAKENNINEMLASHHINQISQSRDYPPRAQIQEIMLSFGQANPQFQIIRDNLLSSLMTAILRGVPQDQEPAGFEFEADDEDNEEDVVNFVFPNLFTAGFSQLMQRFQARSQAVDEADLDEEEEALIDEQAQAQSSEELSDEQAQAQSSEEQAANQAPVEDSQQAKRRKRY